MCERGLGALISLHTDKHDVLTDKHTLTPSNPLKQQKSSLLQGKKSGEKKMLVVCEYLLVCCAYSRGSEVRQTQVLTLSLCGRRKWCEATEQSVFVTC